MAEVAFESRDERGEVEEFSLDFEESHGLVEDWLLRVSTEPLNARAGSTSYEGLEVRGVEGPGGDRGMVVAEIQVLVMLSMTKFAEWEASAVGGAWRNSRLLAAINFPDWIRDHTKYTNAIK